MVMGTIHVELIMDKMVKVFSGDRYKNFYNRIIVLVIVVMLIYCISYIFSGKFLNNHPKLMNFVGIRKIREFDNLKYRALRIDWHTLNADIIDNIKSDCEKPSVNSFIVKTCKDSTAVVN